MLFGFHWKSSGFLNSGHTLDLHEGKITQWHQQRGRQWNVCVHANRCSSSSSSDTTFSFGFSLAIIIL